MFCLLSQYFIFILLIESIFFFGPPPKKCTGLVPLVPCILGGGGQKKHIALAILASILTKCISSGSRHLVREVELNLIYSWNLLNTMMVSDTG